MRLKWDLVHHVILVVWSILFLKRFYLLWCFLIFIHTLIYLRKLVCIGKRINIRFILGVIIFGSIRFLSKKVTKPNFFFKKKPKPGQTDRFRLWSVRFFRAETGSNRLGSVFSGFGSVFPVWLCFFPGFLSVSVWFFQFFVYKTGTEPAGFFKNLISFFFRFGFFGYFFFRFSRFNRFSGFFAHP